MSAQDLLVGDRVVNPGEPVLEWTINDVWVPVCAMCDAPMLGEDEWGYLCCHTCGGSYDDVVMRG